CASTLSILLSIILFFFNHTSTTEIYTLSYTTLFRSAVEKIVEGPFPLGNHLQEKLAGALSRQGHALLEGGEHGVEPVAREECMRSEEHTSELQSRGHLVCRLLLEKKNQLTLGEGLTA